MSTTIRDDDFRRVEVNPGGVIIVDTPTGNHLAASLSPGERRTMAAALDPDRANGGQWTRDDLPSVMDLVRASTKALAVDPSGGANAALDTVVSRADIEKAIKDGGGSINSLVDAVWALLSGNDPAVHIVRESDLQGVEVRRSQRPDGTYRWDTWDDHVDDDERALHLVVAQVKRRAEKLVSALALRRAVEAGQAVDPVEAKAREIYGVANAGATWESAVKSANEGNRVDREVVREYRAIATHVLWQEGNL